MKLGRCQVRVVGVHTHDKTILPTEDLPWAYPMQSINSAAISGIGQSPVGVVEGTWVVIMFRDEDLQQPIIIGCIGGIPQEESKSVDQDEDEQISLDSSVKSPTTDASGKVISSGEGVVTDSSGNTVTDGNGNPVTTGSATQVENTAVTNKASGKAPPDSAKPGIAALNTAMDAAGITGKYGRAAILGIAGGESAWIPQNEGYSYSAEALQIVFSKTFKNKPDLATQYARWKGTREAFFNFVYAPENNGAQLGNTQSGDGGKFYGRGFIQITGRANYARYARLSGIDIASQPNLLNTDLGVSAAIAVAYFRDRVSVSDGDPSYFSAALKAVGGAQSGWPKKESYYQYFLGDATPPAQTDKSTKPGEEVQSVPIAENGLPEDRQKNIVTGFCDPNMKYPLRQYVGEPDTNRLARGRIDGTIVEYKDEKRLEKVSVANGFSWSQPDIPFNAKYPYNKVTETESGHVVEFDDTPENERVHFYHRKGTYIEIDPNGSQVNRIVGDGYEIIDRNGYIYVNGECNVTIGGVARILCQNDVFVDVSGDAKINLGGNADLNVANNFNVNVGGEFKLKASNIKIDSDSDFNVTSAASTNLTAAGSFEVNASGRANIEGSTVHLAEGAASAESASLGAPIQAGERSSQKFAQLKPPPRNLEKEMEFETPDENNTEEAKQYHEKRSNEKVTDAATEVESTPKPENNLEPEVSDCSIIYGMTSIPDNYVLHTDSTGFKWTLGMITRGNSISPGRFYSSSRDKTGKEFSLQEIVCNMKGLAQNVLGPMNENIGKVGTSWTITSAYRNNVPSGGSKTSQHLIGCAVDFVCGSNNFAYKQNYDWATKLASILAYDQILLEYRDPGVNGNKNNQRINWVHVSYSNTGNKKQVLTFLNDKTYAQGLSYLG